MRGIAHYDHLYHLGGRKAFWNSQMAAQGPRADQSKSLSVVRRAYI